MTTTVNYSIDQGTTFFKTFTIYDQSNTLINLSGFNGLMEVRANIGNPTILWTANTRDGANTLYVDPANGNVTINFVNSTFANLIFAGNQDVSSQDFPYDLRLTNGSNQSFVVAGGLLTINRAITR